MRSLILGISGCAGSYLAEYLMEKGYEVFGTTRNTGSVDNINQIVDRISLCEASLHNPESLAEVLNECMPDQIYFFASARHVDSIGSLYKTNVEGTLNFFEVLLRSSCRPRIVLASSSAVYGMQKDSGAINECFDLNPLNHYALVKTLQEKIALYYYTNHGMEVVVARPFNHPGPREKEGLVCADFAVQITDIEKRSEEAVINVGNLKAVRDFTDVRDAVRGYLLLAEKGVAGETYNICSGKGVSIETVLNMLTSISSVNIEVRTDRSRMKPAEVSVQIGDNSKIFESVGWKPEIPIEKTLKDTLEYYRGRG